MKNADWWNALAALISFLRAKTNTADIARRSRGWELGNQISCVTLSAYCCFRLREFLSKLSERLAGHQKHKRRLFKAHWWSQSSEQPRQIFPSGVGGARTSKRFQIGAAAGGQALIPTLSPEDYVFFQPPRLSQEKVNNCGFNVWGSKHALSRLVVGNSFTSQRVAFSIVS